MMSEENKCHVNQTSIKIVFSSGKTYLVNSNCGQTVGSVVARLCGKQTPKVTSFHAFITGNNMELDLSEDCSSHGGREVRVEAADNLDPGQKSAPVMEKICTTTSEAVGDIGQERKCETIQGQVFDNVPSRQCSMVTGTGMVCSRLPDPKYKVRFSYFKT